MPIGEDKELSALRMLYPNAGEVQLLAAQDRLEAYFKLLRQIARSTKVGNSGEIHS